MKSKILIVDDYDEIRELVCFILETNMEVEVLQNACGHDAIKTLQTYPDIKMIITDLNMPNGNGEDILKYLKKEGRSTPIIFMTGDDLAAHPNLSGYPKIGRIPKPFTDEQILGVIKDLLVVADPTQPTYVPVRIELLKKIHEIKTPLFVKINDTKYIKLTQEHSSFDDNTFEKYQSKDVKHLFIEASRIQEFISEYRKKTLSDVAWIEAAGPSTDTEMIKLNTELLRSLVNEVGWSSDLIDIAQDHFHRALKIATTNPDLTHVMHHFQKIERYGYADHCTLIFLVTTKLAHELGFAEEATLQKLTFASLFHDMTLTDEQYQNKDKYLKQIFSRDAAPTKDLKNVVAHPNRAAELCRHWDFCPSIVDIVIFQHHERPDGTGFPMGRRAAELHNLSCLFLFCEDFVEFYIRHFGEADVTKFLKSRQNMYNTGFFIDIVNAFRNAMAPLFDKQKAS